MTIKVMSRGNAVKYSFEPHDVKAAVISISDCDKESPMLDNNPNNGIAAQCKVRFDDVDSGAANCITKRDAQTIVSFVTDIAKNHEKLIVHCEAGVSRSAGVAAAIMKALYGDDWEVFGNQQYVPNMTCYRTVLDAFYYEEKSGRND